VAWHVCLRTQSASHPPTHIPSPNPHNHAQAAEKAVAKAAAEKAAAEKAAKQAAAERAAAAAKEAAGRAAAAAAEREAAERAAAKAAAEMRKGGGGNGGGGSATEADEWSIDAAAVAKFTQMFTEACAAQGSGVDRLGKAEAGAVLFLSGLPVPTLLQIWSLADVDGDDQLDLKEYLLCCWLVQRSVQKQLPPPTALPQQLLESATAAVAPTVKQVGDPIPLEAAGGMPTPLAEALGHGAVLYEPADDGAEAVLFRVVGAPSPPTPPPLSRTESQGLADALQVPVAEVRAARAAEATMLYDAAPPQPSHMAPALEETRRQLVLEQLQAAAAPPLSLLDPGTLRFALEQARQNGVGGSEVEAAELTLRAATELEPPLVAMLEQLGIAPAPLVQANLRSIAAVGADAGALRAALGAAEAAALLDAAQRAAVTPSELEVAVARLVVGERLGAGSFGTVSRHHIWLQPASYMVAAGIIYACSRHHIWLQPAIYMVAAGITCACCMCMHIHLHMCMRMHMHMHM